MGLTKGHVGILVVVVFGLAYTSYICFPWILTSFSPFLQQDDDSFTPTAIRDELLDTALEGASMEKKMLIISVVNKAYSEEGSMLDLFLNSFKVGQDTQVLLNHLLIVAVDQTAFDRCNLLHQHCYKLVTEGVDFSGEKLYMSGDFLKMMWKRTLFLADVLMRGYSFIFTDADVMWLRNPFEKLLRDGEEDLHISCDTFNGNPSDKANPINTGFYFVVSSSKARALFKMWYAARKDSLAIKEQDVLAQMIQGGVFQQLDLKVRFLDTNNFGGFCHGLKDFNSVITFHANCCLTIKAKIKDLSVLLDAWSNFRSSSNNSSSTYQLPKLDACSHSWDIINNNNHN